ncbi:hypothetical protein ACFQ0B_46780 [Nonomuraea thailandensis]
MRPPHRLRRWLLLGRLGLIGLVAAIVATVLAGGPASAGPNLPRPTTGPIVPTLKPVPNFPRSL